MACCSGQVSWYHCYRIDTGCGCAGKASGRVVPTTVARAVLMTVASAVALAAGARFPLTEGASAFALALVPAGTVAFRALRWRSNPLIPPHHHMHHATHAHHAHDVETDPALSAAQVALRARQESLREAGAAD